MWAESGADADTSVANHQEVDYGIFRNADGSYFVQAISPLGSPCDAKTVSIPGSLTLVATMHPHPFHWGAVYPAACGAMAGKSYKDLLPGFAVNGRASGDDWLGSQTLGVPGYIVDYDGVYKYDGVHATIKPIGGTDTYFVSDGPAHYNQWPRSMSSGSCHLP